MACCAVKTPVRERANGNAAVHVPGAHRADENMMLMLCSFFQRRPARGVARRPRARKRALNRRRGGFAPAAARPMGAALDVRPRRGSHRRRAMHARLSKLTNEMW